MPVIADGALIPSAPRAVGATSGSVTYPLLLVDALDARPLEIPGPLAANATRDVSPRGAVGLRIKTR